MWNGEAAVFVEGASGIWGEGEADLAGFAGEVEVVGGLGGEDLGAEGVGGEDDVGAAGGCFDGGGGEVADGEGVVGKEICGGEAEGAEFAVGEREFEFGGGVVEHGLELLVGEDELGVDGNGVEDCDERGDERGLGDAAKLHGMILCGRRGAGIRERIRMGVEGAR